MKKPLIGFIGQGFVGKNLADNFEERGYEIIRYSLDDKFKNNRDKIKKCDVVFIAVPTPTTPKGFDPLIIEKVLPLVGKGKVAVIKSTILPGTTKRLANKFGDLYIFHSPEFLTEANARKETDNPPRNIIGMPKKNQTFINKAKLVMSLLPKSPYELVCSSEEAELIKYGGNNFLYSKIVFMNVLFDYAQKIGADWDKVSDALSHDDRIGKSHMKPYHKTSGKVGRGAGGHCFIKDMEAFIEGYKKANKKDVSGLEYLLSMRNKNVELLVSSKKDLELVKEVYGNKIKKLKK